MNENVLVDKLKHYFAFESFPILVVSDFLFVSGTGIWSPYLNIYLTSIGLSALNIGLISTLQNAVSSPTIMP